MKNNHDNTTSDLSLNQRFLFLTFILSTFLASDIYYFGFGRPFDYLSISILLVTWIFFGKLINKSKFIFYSTSSLLLSMPWVIFGYINDHFLGSSAFLLGIAFILPTIASIDSVEVSSALENCIKFTISISIILLIIQMFFYYFNGSFIDFMGAVGSIESRGLNVGLNYFRPSGIFQEPNAYCTVMFTLLYLCLFINNRNYLIEILGILSLIITQSLWGFGAALLLLFLLYNIKVLFKSFLLILIFIFLFYFTLHDQLNSIIESSVTIERILNIEDDPSRAARYGSINNINLDEFLFFGHGIDTQNFQSIAANGYGFLLYSFGLIGMILMAFYFIYLTKSNINILLAISFVLTTFPPFSYVYFWVWIGMILFLSRVNNRRPSLFFLNRS